MPVSLLPIGMKSLGSKLAGLLHSRGQGKGPDSSSLGRNQNQSSQSLSAFAQEQGLP